MTGPFRAITFDCYGTLIDWDGGAGAVLADWAARVGLDVETDLLLGVFADAQVRHQEMADFKPYRVVLGDGFVDMARAFGVEPEAADVARFAGSVGEWPAFPDTVVSLGDLARDHLLCVVSNVDDASFAASHVRLGGVMDEVVTADEVRTYKPNLAHFHAMLERLAARGIGRAEVLHVAQSRFHDLAPERLVGLTSLWVDRHAGLAGRGITQPSDAEPDFRVTTPAEAASLVASWRAG